MTPLDADGSRRRRLPPVTRSLASFPVRLAGVGSPDESGSGAVLAVTRSDGPREPTSRTI